MFEKFAELRRIQTRIIFENQKNLAWKISVQKNSIFKNDGKLTEATDRQKKLISKNNGKSVWKIFDGKFKKLLDILILL